MINEKSLSHVTVKDAKSVEKDK